MANIVCEIRKILSDQSYAESIRKHLFTIRDTLGQQDGSAELARLAAEMLRSDCDFSSGQADGYIPPV